MSNATAEELTCKELVELITEFLEGQLSRQDRARFKRHLRGCDGCSTYLEQMRLTIRLTGTLREKQIDPVAREALLAAFRDWKSR
jgi:anti-sigma factor RsiW